MDTPRDLRRADVEALRARARWAGLFTLLGELILALFYLLLGRPQGTWQLSLLGWLWLATGLLSLAGLVLHARARERGGRLLIISGLPIAVLATALLIQGSGLTLGVVGVGWIALLAVHLFPAPLVAPWTLLAALVGLASVLIEEFAQVPLRAGIGPDVGFFAPAVGAGLVVLFALPAIREFPHYSLRTKFLVSFLATALVPLVVLAYVNNQAARASLTEEANQKLLAAASQMAQNIDNFIESNLDAVRTEAQIEVLESYMGTPPDERRGTALEKSALEALRVHSRKDPRNIYSYGLLNLRGINVLDSDPDNIGRNESGRDYFRRAMSTGRPYVSYVQMSQDALPSLYFSAPVRDPEGRILGVLRVQYRARVLQEMLVANQGLAGPESFAVLFDDHFIHLAHSAAPDTILKKAGPLTAAEEQALKAAHRLPDLPTERLSTNLPELEAQLAAASEDPFFEAEDIATGERINQVAVVQMETQPWLVAFFQPQDVLFAPVARQTRGAVLVALVITPVTSAAAVGASQTLSQPLRRLTEAATRVAEGDLSVRAEVLYADEVGLLAQAFNSMTERLQDLVIGLETRVAERTRDLERRANQLQAAAEVAKHAATIRDLDRLLNDAVRLISERFGYYHAGVFLVDDDGEYAVLRAASSEGGQRMLARGHRLAVGKVGIVGYVTGTGRPRIALDVGEDAVHFANPDLPLTRSEMALPLKIGDRIIGALDVQSVEPNAFDQDDIIVLQTMADQLAIAIDNARLLERQTRLAAQRRRAIELYRSLAQLLSYDDLLADVADRLRDELGYSRVVVALQEGEELVVRSFATDGTRPAPEPGAFVTAGQRLLGRAALRRAPVLATPAETGELDPLLQQVGHGLAVPLISRGETIGALFVEAAGEATFGDDEIELVELVASQVAVALENARLFEETQRSLHQLDALLRQQTSAAWTDLLRSMAARGEPLVFEFGEAEGEAADRLEAALDLRGQALGRLIVEAREAGVWTRDDLEILQAVAQEVAGQLEQLRLLQEIRRRAVHLETAAEVARAATGVLNLEALLERAVNLIRDRFGYYHVGVFLLDEEGRAAVLHQATGEAGASMKARGHRLEVGSRSIIGHVTASGRSYVAHNVADDPYHRPNPLLPETRTELGIPMKIGERVIGALDVQHTEPYAFEEDEIAVLETLADQLAVAVQNARQYQEALARAEREQAVVEITSRVRAAGDIEGMVKTALQEIQQRVGARRARLRLVETPGRTLEGDGRVTGPEGNGRARQSSGEDGQG